MREASGRVAGRHEDEFTSDHTGRRGAGGPRFDGGPRSLLGACLEALRPLKTPRGEAGTGIG